jgi:transposase-like protein
VLLRARQTARVLPKTITIDKSGANTRRPSRACTFRLGADIGLRQSGETINNLVEQDHQGHQEDRARLTMLELLKWVPLRTCHPGYGIETI